MECALNILLTGGAGYIGSHTYVALVKAGYTPVILDNFRNSHKNVLPRLEQITGKPVILEEGDVLDTEFVKGVIKKHNTEAAIHFAALKAVGESNANPLLYYRQNFGGLVSLLDAMQANGCNKIVYSSSATVYGAPTMLPVAEDAAYQHESVYAHTKLVGEQMLEYVTKANPAFKPAILRYFNPVGAHDSGMIGEDPSGIPNNLMPYICQVATGHRPALAIFGNDYSTSDGTGVRDYIHVMDLADGHVLALKHLIEKNERLTLNLGTGRGYSVLEVVKAFEKACGKKIPTQIAGRRPGDVAIYYADPALAEKTLGWKATRDIDAMCADSWNWQSKNPNGYAS